MNDYADYDCDPREMADEMDAYYAAELAHENATAEAAYLASLPTRDEVIAAANGEELPF